MDNYEEADKIRKEIESKGYRIEDTKEGSWLISKKSGNRLFVSIKENGNNKTAKSNQSGG